jgi:hypothetical protein
MDMTKHEAAAIFGGTFADLARALAMTRGGISQWPEVLTEAQSDRVLGAALRLQRKIPAKFRRRARPTTVSTRSLAAPVTPPPTTTTT